MKSGAFKVAAIVAATTVGDGVFALPYVFYESGWLLGLFYMALLGTFVVTAHVVYLKTLEKEGEKERLLGLSRMYLGVGGFWTAFFAIVFGLLLTLVAYLILGTQFIQLAIPGIPSGWAFLGFWIIISLPVFLSDRYVVDLELVGIICTSLVIAFIFISAWPAVFFNTIPAINWHNFFLPFGAVLFALAGWTSVEPAYETRKGLRKKFDPWRALALGTLFAGVLYILFAAGIIGSAPFVSPDTATGLMLWPEWKRDIIAILGVLAVATVYLPISREIKNSLEKDLKWSKLASRGIIVVLPALLVTLGVNNFLIVVGLVGGLFLSTQYILIISVGRRALRLTSVQKFFLDLVVAIFIIAAVYELATFIVH